MSEVVVSSERVRERALRALRISGRRLVWQGESWGVVMGGDRRRRPMATLTTPEVEQLAAEGAIARVGEAEYVLAGFDRVPAPPKLEPWAFIAAGRARGKAAGTGFMGLALKARTGHGPLSLRQAKAGLQLVADAEVQASDARLTMDWEAGPADKNRRTGSVGGWRGAAVAAGRRLERVKASVGAEMFSLAWALCVEGMTVRRLKARFGLPDRRTGALVAAALEAVAGAYDAGR